MFNRFLSFILDQITGMGVSGLIIAILLIAIYVVWRALQAERQRCVALADKLYDLAKETAIMIERITGR